MSSFFSPPSHPKSVYKLRLEGQNGVTQKKAMWCGLQQGDLEWQIPWCGPALMARNKGQEERAKEQINARGRPLRYTVEGQEVGKELV